MPDTARQRARLPLPLDRDGELLAAGDGSLPRAMAALVAGAWRTPALDAALQTRAMAGNPLQASHRHGCSPVADFEASMQSLEALVGEDEAGETLEESLAAYERARRSVSPLPGRWNRPNCACACSATRPGRSRPPRFDSGDDA